VADGTIWPRGDVPETQAMPADLADLTGAFAAPAG
jgi:hypothetical protein